MEKHGTNGTPNQQAAPAATTEKTDGVVATDSTATADSGGESAHGNGRSPQPVATSPATPPDLQPAEPFWRRKPSRSFWIRLAIGLVIITASVFTNRSYVGWGLFATFAILIVPIGRIRSFVVSFGPYAGVWFIFTALRSLADETVLAKTLSTKSSHLERWLFNGQLPSNILQDHLFNPNHLHWYDYACTGVHWSYFIIPHLLAIRLWQKHPEVFKRYLRAMTLTLAVGLCIYFLIPSNPPWMAPEAVNSPAGATVYRIMKYVGDQIGGGIYRASYKVIGESNPIAAMPSIHFAITFLLVYGAGAFGKRWRFLFLLYAAIMAFSLVYLGEHYVIDIFVGGLITTYGWIAAGTWMARPIVIRTKRTDRARSPVGAAQGVHT